jgi:hypothetical integral membrane protein (TIGR02206 family)
MTGSPLHFIMLGLSAFLIIATVCVDRRWQCRQLIAIAAFVGWAAILIWWLWPSHFDASRSLPLHVCDLAGVIGPIALWYRWRWARTLLFFWGIGLTTQGFITPVVQEGPDTTVFWLFWLNHGLVLSLAIDDLVVGGYRPMQRDTIKAIVISVGYIIIMFTLDAITGWNYAFVGPPEVIPSEVLSVGVTFPGAELPVTTAADLFGPWPWRAMWMSLVGVGWLALLGWAGSRWRVGGDSTGATKSA